MNVDSAVLEVQEVRKDLPCNVTQVKPALGFDFKFHAGYEVDVPIKELVTELPDETCGHAFSTPTML